MSEAIVQTRQQLIEHIQKLREDFEAVGNEWENADIHTFLDAMARWLEECNGYYRNTGQSMDVEKASWQILADTLSAARVYE